MELIVRFDTYRKDKGVNSWLVMREDKANCTFPLPARIEEIGNQILGNRKGDNMFCGSERLGRNYLVLFILPGTYQPKIEKMAIAIAGETELYPPPK